MLFSVGTVAFVKGAVSLSWATTLNENEMKRVKRMLEVNDMTEEQKKCDDSKHTRRKVPMYLYLG